MKPAPTKKSPYVELHLFGKAKLVTREEAARFVRNWRNGNRQNPESAVALDLVTVRTAHAITFEDVNGFTRYLVRYCNKPQSPFFHETQNSPITIP